VPAANDLFSEDLLRKFTSENIRFFNIDWSRFMGLGRSNPADHAEPFSMTYFGAKVSQEINAVSRIHRGVSRKLLNPLWPNYKPEELHIGSVTNGVHYNTWAARQWQELCMPDNGEGKFDESWKKKINKVPAADIWKIKTDLKKTLVEGVKKKMNSSMFLSNNPKRTLDLINSINENALFIGFARRFVQYKRSGLLFTSIERLAGILGNVHRPVVFLFSGKAHPADTESIKLITKLITAAANPGFRNSIIFLEDYSMDVSTMLVQGVDVWLNTPDRYMEASGTSGMKAALNGVLNFSVMDGWWAEAYNGKNGWMLVQDPTYKDHELQNQLDAEIIYNTLENEIIPLFFDRDENDIPVKWIDHVKASLTSIVPMFNMKRMLVEYDKKYYKRLSERVARLRADNFKLARQIAAWKRTILPHWNEVEVISIDSAMAEKMRGSLGEEIRIEVVLEIGRLNIADVGVEILISGSRLPNGYYRKDFSVINHRDKEVTYECILRMEQTGSFDFAFRIFAKNDLLPHRQDFDLVKWI
jgi:alpha-glucan phosphorylase-like protein